MSNRFRNIGFIALCLVFLVLGYYASIFYPANPLDFTVEGSKTDTILIIDTTVKEVHFKPDIPEPSIVYVDRYIDTGKNVVNYNTVENYTLSEVQPDSSGMDNPKPLFKTNLNKNIDGVILDGVILHDGKIWDSNFTLKYPEISKQTIITDIEPNNLFGIKGSVTYNPVTDQFFFLPSVTYTNVKKRIQLSVGSNGQFHTVSFGYIINPK